MALGPVGIWCRDLRYHEDRGEIADAAAELEQLGYGALFLPDAGGDVLGDVEHVLAATRTVAVVTGILNVWMHDAQAVAEGRAGLEQRHPGRFTLGLGASHRTLVGERYRRPYSTMRDYLDQLDAATPPVPERERILAALGPRMLELARDRAGGAHPYLVPPEHTRRARELLGPARLLAPEQAVLLETDPARARERGRAHVAHYLELSNYVANLERLGFGEADRSGGGSDRLVDAIVAWGDEAAIAARVAEHLAAGADHVCIQVVEEGVLPRAAWRRLAPALTEAAVGSPAS
jgi:probable F420-dependent oxidoreductase